MKNDHFIPESAVRGELATAREIANQLASAGMADEGAPGYFIKTFGCQQNEADSERLAGLAELMGYRPVGDPSEAKLILVNTCAVREHAEKRALSIIGEYKHIKERDPNVVIGVGGCMVTQQSRADKLKMSCPYVSFTFDTGSLHTVPSLVMAALQRQGRSFIVGDEYKIAEGLPLARASRHSAWLSVMYGCNNFCSYCIVPYVRGRERSRLADDIVKEAERLVADGAKEITLLGQNVNSYGLDLDGQGDIASLMHRICAIDGDFRLRFMTSHPKDASDALIEAVATEDKIVKHFHLPVQSGSDDVLRRMNRKYTAEHYLRTIEKIKSACPDITLTTDIIVGFPGETEKDFRDTVELLRRVRYDMCFSFIFSPRDGTPASKMDGQIDRETAVERLRLLSETQDEISMERCGRFVGRTLRLLADEVSRTDKNMLTGRGQPARPVHFAGEPSTVGKFVDVKITSSGSYSMEGTLTEE